MQIPEERIFDKADQAEESEKLRGEHVKVEAEIDELEKELKSCDEASRPDLERRVARHKKLLETIAAELASVEKDADEEDAS